MAACAHGVSTHSHPKVAAAEPKLVGSEDLVSTHSHPKVAAQQNQQDTRQQKVSTHSHPKVAAATATKSTISTGVSTHSHPKVAAYFDALLKTIVDSFNTQPPEGGCPGVPAAATNPVQFQHTATRRWLRVELAAFGGLHRRFNTQPPEGGCIPSKNTTKPARCFNTQPPEGGCKKLKCVLNN